MKLREIKGYGKRYLGLNMIILIYTEIAQCTKQMLILFDSPKILLKEIKCMSFFQYYQ